METQDEIGTFDLRPLESNELTEAALLLFLLSSVLIPRT